MLLHAGHNLRFRACSTIIKRSQKKRWSALALFSCSGAAVYGEGGLVEKVNDEKCPWVRGITDV
jgi:hypothetical protein